MIGVSPLRLCRGVSDDFLLVTDDADMDEGIIGTGVRTTGAIPNSILALFLTAAVGFAIASLCRLTNSAIETIFSFGFTSTGGLGVGSTGSGIGSIDFSLIRADNRLSVISCRFARCCLSRAIMRRPSSADDISDGSSCDDPSVVALTLAERAPDVRRTRRPNCHAAMSMPGLDMRRVAGVSSAGSSSATCQQCTRV
jgi:hypothetical protein